MNLGDAYTLGVRLTGDITSLRSELRLGTQVVSQFAQASTEAMNRAAGAMQAAAISMANAGGRARRATEDPQRSLSRSAASFEDYARRASRAQDEVARTSESTASRTARSWGGLSMSLGRLTGFAGIGLLAKQIWDAGMGFNEFTQNAEVAMSTLLGSKEAARGFLDEVLAFAKQTPYAFTDLTAEAQKLLSFGFQAEQVIPILRATGDAAQAMGRGTEGVQRLNRALGQIQAKGRLQSEELLQMNEIGVNGLAILANQAGMTAIEYQRLITAGLIPADEAIAGLVEGIREGTDGVNGQTKAFGGLMAQIKGSGGITATVDSARSSFRNMSGELTTALVPAYTGFLRLATQGMGVLKSTAGVFNALPQPVQSTALAFAATAIAVRLLNREGRVSDIWTTYKTHLAVARTNLDAASMSAGRMRTHLVALRTASIGAGSALLGAFGGPVGIAVTAAASAFAAFSATAADAKARADSYAEALRGVGDEATAAAEQVAKQNLITGDNADWGWFQKLTTGSESAADAVEELGLSLDEVASAIVGPQEEFDALIARLEDMGYGATINEVITKLHQQRTALERQRHEQEQLNEAQATGVEAAQAQGRAYQQAWAPLRQFTEEQQKAIDTAEEAARKAFTPNLGSLSLNLATERDVARAREAVEDATRRVRDAEDDRAALSSRDTVTARDRRRADESVADAREALAEATESLADTEARTDPVAQYRRQLEQMVADSQRFVADIQALADQGLNAVDLQQLIAAGPQASADARKALLADPSLVGDTNDVRAILTGLADDLAAQSAVVQTGLDDAGRNFAGTMGLAMRIALSEGAYDTVADLAAALGEDPQLVYDVGMRYGIAFMSGMSDAMAYQRTMTVTPDGGIRYGRNTQAAFASGGIFHGVFPGYSPGRDTGMIAVGGGEAIMRPEWTRAVGPDFVHRMNSLAINGGVDAVRRAMGTYLGAFAGGGIAPQVVTVPVRTENTTHAPWTIERAYFTDRDEATRWGNRSRARAQWTGGRRGR